MNKILKFIEDHILKILTIPFLIDAIQILATFLQAIDDQMEGILDCDQMNSLIKDGNYLCMIVIAIVAAYLKITKKK